MRSANPATQERQAKCFDLSLQGFSNVQISSLLKLDRKTVATHIASEAARRASERSDSRVALVEKSISALERIAAESSLRVRRLLADADAADNPNVAAALRSVVPREVHLQLKVCEQQARTLGLFAPVAIDLGESQETQDLRARLWAAENTIRLRVIAEQRERFINGESDELPQC